MFRKRKNKQLIDDINKLFRISGQFFCSIEKFMNILLQSQAPEERYIGSINVILKFTFIKELAKCSPNPGFVPENFSSQPPVKYS